jgi:hypothetical protein
MSIYDAKSGFAKEINNLSCAIAGRQQDVSWLRKVFGMRFRKEEVNRQILKENLYKSIFDA